MYKRKIEQAKDSFRTHIASFFFMYQLVHIPEEIEKGGTKEIKGANRKRGKL